MSPAPGRHLPAGHGLPRPGAAAHAHAAGYPPAGSLMRWLLIHPGPNFSVSDVHTGWVEALRGLGQQVAEYNLDRRLTFYDQALLADDIGDEEGRTAVHKALTREQAILLAAQPILSEAMMAWPHVVLLTSAFFVPHTVLEVLRDRGMT